MVDLDIVDRGDETCEPNDLADGDRSDGGDDCGGGGGGRGDGDGSAAACADAAAGAAATVLRLRVKRIAAVLGPSPLAETAKKQLVSSNLFQKSKHELSSIQI